MFDFSGLNLQRHSPQGVRVLHANHELCLEVLKDSETKARRFTVVHRSGQFEIYHRSSLSNSKINNHMGELLIRTDDMGKMLRLLGYKLDTNTDWYKQYYNAHVVG